ncbi:MAG TPA: glucose 1-dehydrogenase [Candidatus Dormibacteraeota bacterium]|nr:glucose 1-dehydrogenase [Candidatus Dormibacteraeota bacterium]
MRFQDQVAIVTGAGSGIGRETALQLAREGALVAVADIDGTRAAAVAAEVGAERALAVVVDVTAAEQVRQMVRTVLDRFDHIDVLVSNAGWDRTGPFVETDEALWDKVIAINFRGHLACVHAVLPTMIARGAGRIVTVASDAGRVGSSGEVVYSGAKGGVIAFTKGVAREVARSGIAVNCVAPGLTDTPMLAEVSVGSERLMEAIVRAIPMRRLGRPEEVAQAILFLASGQAAYITGQTLSVNGGLTMV